MDELSPEIRLMPPTILTQTHRTAIL